MNKTISEGRVVIEGVGIPVIGYEENYIQFEDGRDIVAIADLTEAAGADSIDWEHATGFEYAGDDHWAEPRAEFRAKTGRALPRVYRMKFTCEVEALSEADTEAWWKKQQRPT